MMYKDWGWCPLLCLVMQGHLHPILIMHFFFKHVKYVDDANLLVPDNVDVYFLEE